MGGISLKIDNEIVGLTKHRDHTHARVCSRCLLSNKEDQLTQQQPKIAGFLVIRKEKRSFCSPFSFSSKERHQSY